MKVKLESVLFVMIDIQAKFESVIYDLDIVLKNTTILNKASVELDIPLIVTEQYPRGLGHTMECIYLPESAPVFEKKKFSIFNEEIAEAIKSSNKSTLVLYGVETHVCLMQSALDAKALGYNVIVIEDAVSSRTERNKKIAIQRFLQHNIEVMSVEMILFELMQTATHSKFRTISKLVK